MMVSVTIDKPTIIIALLVLLFALYLYMEANATLSQAAMMHEQLCEVPAWLS